MKQCSHCLAVFRDTLNECPEDNCVLIPSQETSALQSSDNPSTSDGSRNDPLIGAALADRYQVISVVGNGGMGTVYKAKHKVMERIVAVKVLHSHLASRPNALKRFHEEAKTIAQLQHHNIITLFDFGISPSSQPFLVMDYIDGFSLKKLLDQNGSVSFEEMSVIFKQIADGLAYAHQSNVIHRDLKPENIMLTRREDNQYKVTLVDFGLATLAIENNGLPMPPSKNPGLLGSPFYMSPEQCLTNGKVDNRSDIYSLAVVLYEALAGRLPYDKKSGLAMLENHLHKPPMPFNLTQTSMKVCTELTRVFSQALAKDPKNRYQTIEDFAAEMSDALQRDTVKWRAIRHRTLVARETMTRTGSVLDEDAITNEQLTEVLFQTGSKFLSRQAEIESVLFTSDKEKEKENEKENKHKKSKAAKTALPPEETEKKQCLYCGAMMPAGILFCLSCQRKIEPHPNKLSQTYACVATDLVDLNSKEASQQVKSNIQNLRFANLSVSLAKAQRYLIFAITSVLLVIFLMICRNYIDIDKSAKYLTQFVSSTNKPIAGSYNNTFGRKRH